MSFGAVKIQSNILLGAVVLFVFSTQAEVRTFEYTTEDGTVVNVPLPDENAVYFPLFEVSDADISASKNKLESCKIERIEDPANDALGKELVRYGLKAYTCDFGDERWGCLLYSPVLGAKDKALPMVVHIPGKGEIGEDLSRQFHQRQIFDVVTSKKFQEVHPCHMLVVSPPEGLGTYYGNVPGKPNKPQRRTVRLVQEMIEVVGGGSLVDTNRLYITGFAVGGDAAYLVAADYSQFFVAAVPIASIAPSRDFISETRPGNFWHVCNEGDRTGRGKSFEAVCALRDYVNECGGDFRVSVYPAENGHDAWTSAWKEEIIWAWMFSKSLSSPNGTKRKNSLALNVGAPISFAGAKCTASVAAYDDAHDETRPLDFLGKTYYRPIEGFSRNDWWQVELSAPVAGVVKIETGDEKGAYLLSAGYVELSGNGRTWRRGASFSKVSGMAEFKATTPFKFLRVKSTQNAKDLFVIRSLAIFKTK